MFAVENHAIILIVLLYIIHIELCLLLTLSYASFVIYYGNEDSNNEWMVSLIDMPRSAANRAIA